MKILLFSATELGKVAIGVAQSLGYKIAGIVTLPRDFSISYSKEKISNCRYVSFDQTAAELSIPLLMQEAKASDLYEAISKIEHDLILVAGWYHMLPKKIRELSRSGCIGLHASLLPKYRGGAPLVWAMIEGEKRTGVSLYYLEDGVDTGNIIGQESFEIEDNDTIAHLISKSGEAAIKLLKNYLPMLANGSAPSVRQDETLATYYPQRSPADGLIDWTWPADKIERFVRAQTRPYPGAFTEWHGKKITLWDASIQEEI